jgi:hypothetical protein
MKQIRIILLLSAHMVAATTSGQFTNSTAVAIAPQSPPPASGCSCEFCFFEQEIDFLESSSKRGL